MKKKKRIKYINPEMEYNPGLAKFEPKLPLKKSSKKQEKRKTT